MKQVNTEKIFDDNLCTIKAQLSEETRYDLVIGIPFFKESKDLPELLKLLDELLGKLIGKRYLIVCAGDECCQDTLAMIKELYLVNPHLEYLMPTEISGRGMSIRTFLEIANIMEADLIVFSANMATEQGIGINEIWLEQLLSPINGNYDMVFGSVHQYFGLNGSAPYFTLPILETVYGIRINSASGGIYAFDHSFVEELAEEAKFWTGFIDGYGFDIWAITRALVWNKMICEVQLGARSLLVDPQRANLIFFENAMMLSECIKRDQDFWFKEHLVIKVPDILARRSNGPAEIVEFPVDMLLNEFKRLTIEFIDVLESALSPSMVKEIKILASLPHEDFSMPEELWVKGVFCLLSEYAFSEDKACGEALWALAALYNGRVASNILAVDSFKKIVKDFPQKEQKSLTIQKICLICSQITEEFWKQRADMGKDWERRAEKKKPSIIPQGYMEYVPGKPVVVPKEIKGKDNNIVYVEGVFNQLNQKYESKFERFLIKGLGLSKNYSPSEAVAAVDKFMEDLESSLEQVFPGDVTTKEGLEQFVEKLFAILRPEKILVVKEFILRDLLIHYPPINLMIPLQYKKVSDMLREMDVRDAMTYLGVIEDRCISDAYIEKVFSFIRPNSFEKIKLKPIIISEKLPFAVLCHPHISELNRATGRLTIRNTVKGKGGKFPKIRYFTSILRSLGASRHYTSFTEQIIRERKNIGVKILNAMSNAREGGDFSANNIFENVHQRELVRLTRVLAKKLSAEGNFGCARLLRLMADGHGLSQVLKDGTYLTCTAWSWSATSFKGGEEIPRALSCSVEGRWFNHYFLESMYSGLGYGQDEILRRVYRFIENGKGEKTLLDSLMSSPPRGIDVIVQEITEEPSKPLQRCLDKPLLQPIASNDWESKYVLNPGALRLGDKVYLFYRAVGKDEISRIGLAITDGYKVLERLPEPIFAPILPQEAKGCEDPRIVVIDNRILMMYTAYDGNIAQIAIASIRVKDFLKRRFDRWRRDGLPFENIWDKDGVIFPEKIKGKYVLYHRIDPSVWAVYIDKLGSYETEQQYIIMGPRPGQLWDSKKIGAGSQPIKTKYGWLLIYHGVDYSYIYRLGVILVNLHDPHKVVYRSPNAVLAPEKDFELGESGAWVPNVVFTCGAVPAVDKEMLDENDEILVYYGAADTSIGVAKAKVGDLIPEKYRIISG